MMEISYRKSDGSDFFKRRGFGHADLRVVVNRMYPARNRLNADVDQLCNGVHRQAGGMQKCRQLFVFLRFSARRRARELASAPFAFIPLTVDRKSVFDRVFAAASGAFHKKTSFHFYNDIYGR